MATYLVANSYLDFLSGVLFANAVLTYLENYLFQEVDQIAPVLAFPKTAYLQSFDFLKIL